MSLVGFYFEVRKPFLSCIGLIWFGVVQQFVVIGSGVVVENLIKVFLDCENIFYEDYCIWMKGLFYL